MSILLTTWKRTVALSLCLAASVHAQPVTTIITHGFDPDAGKNELGPWLQAMAQAIIARSGGQGSIWTYQPANGYWEGGGLVSVNEPIVLVFDWIDESDFEFLPPGNNWGYAEAAADALYAALRDPSGPLATVLTFDLVQGRKVHFIGHSRGTCVNSEVCRRLALADIPVDQVTTLDPHPVDGIGRIWDWGDPMPKRWKMKNGLDVTWADNYWRADISIDDFDGMFLPDTTDWELVEDDLNACLSSPAPCCDNCGLGQSKSEGYGLEHSDVHLWYHGSIETSSACVNDGDACLSADMRPTWYGPFGGCNASTCELGYFYSVIGGGSAIRPGPQPPGSFPLAAPTLYNGTFEQDTYAGWNYHGGGGDASIVQEGGNWRMKFAYATGLSRTHNRFFMPANAATIRFIYKATGTDALDTLVMTISASGVSPETETIILFNPTPDFVVHTMQIPPRFTERACTLDFEMESNGASTNPVVLVDDVSIQIQGSIVAWGDNDFGQTNVPAPNSGIVGIEAGVFHSLGLKNDGSIVGWGYNSSGQTSVPAPNSGFVAISAGFDHSLGLRQNGSVVAWGSNVFGQLNVPAPNTNFVAITAGAGHNLGLKNDGSIVGWGDNSFGQTNVPAPNSGFVAVAAGFYQSLALKQDGSIIAWGGDLYGLLSVPAPNSDFVGIAAGWNHSLAIKVPFAQCPAADINCDGVVNVADLLAVINAWGPCDGCPADVTGNGIVDVADLLMVINNWGP